MSTAVATMLDVLNLERLEVNLFRGRSPRRIAGSVCSADR